ncbi:thaumatin [Favolaschia claudopus]|uniref:Thaumatin n=1 Tax=Favolaschia claudopus TaxID=2862362 RepID=A0AAW0A9F2_9AGAR
MQQFSFLSTLAFISLATMVSAEPSTARFITVLNDCPFTVWPAFFTASGPQPEQVPGWEAKPRTGLTFATATNWSGRIWGRRVCDFSTGSTNPDTCLSGGCNGGLICNTTTGTGVPPATLATIDFSGTSKDIYTVSVVDGYNLPMAFVNNGGCSFASCPVDLATSCPVDLAGPFDRDGQPVGCKSACLRDALAGNAGNSSNCCTGSFGSQEACPTSSVEHYSYFKQSCPNSFAYAFDESSGTAVFQCPKAVKFDEDVEYTVTFCPDPFNL